MTQFIAELGSNHNGDFARACQLIDLAAHIGCAAVKFQLYRPERLFCAEALVQNPGLREKPVLPVEWVDPLIARAHANGLRIGVTPFDLGAVDVLAARPQLDFVKVASYSLLHYDLLRAVSGLGKQVMVGTGMATEQELLTAASCLADAPYVAWLHCVSKYPTSPTEANLSRIAQLRMFFPRRASGFGWSDHTCSEAVLFRAAWRFNVDYIEAHLDLDGAGAEFGDGHCWLPGPLGKVIAALDDACDLDYTINSNADAPERLWRADPSDGLRPTVALRKTWALLSKSS